MSYLPQQSDLIVMKWLQQEARCEGRGYKEERRDRDAQFTLDVDDLWLFVEHKHVQWIVLHTSSEHKM